MYSDILRREQQRQLEAALAQSLQPKERPVCKQVTSEDDDERS